MQNPNRSRGSSQQRDRNAPSDSSRMPRNRSKAPPGPSPQSDRNNRAAPSHLQGNRYHPYHQRGGSAGSTNDAGRIGSRDRRGGGQRDLQTDSRGAQKNMEQQRRGLPQQQGGGAGAKPLQPQLPPQQQQFPPNGAPPPFLGMPPFGQPHMMPPGGVPPHMMPPHMMPPFGGMPPHMMPPHPMMGMPPHGMQPFQRADGMGSSASGSRSQFSAEEMRRKVFVGNLPDDTTSNDLQTFFAKVGTVNNVQLKSQKHYAFVEFTSVDDARRAIAQLDESNFRGTQIRVRSTEKKGSKAIDPNNPNRLFIGYIPQGMTEKAVRGLFETLGPLKYFHLVMDNQTGKSRGYAFCEYEDTSMTNMAIERLHGTEIMGKRLVVQRANDPDKKASQVLKYVQSIVSHYGDSLDPVLSNLNNVFSNPTYTPTTIVHLLNMFDPEECRGNQKRIEQLRDEVLAEAERYGSVQQMVVPIPGFDPDGQGAWKDGFGRVFLQYSTPQEARTAQMGMTGRHFHGRLVASSFFEEADLNKALEQRTFAELNL